MGAIERTDDGFVVDLETGEVLESPPFSPDRVEHWQRQQRLAAEQVGAWEGEKRTAAIVLRRLLAEHEGSYKSAYGTTVNSRDYEVRFVPLPNLQLAEQLELVSTAEAEAIALESIKELDPGAVEAVVARIFPDLCQRCGSSDDVLHGTAAPEDATVPLDFDHPARHDFEPVLGMRKRREDVLALLIQKRPVRGSTYTKAAPQLAREKVSA